MVDNNDSDMHLSVVEMEQQLRESGFLDPTLGVREERGLRDPMLTILFDPAKEVTMDDGETVTVIDSLLMTAHTEMQRAYGDIYNNFDMIQNTMETLIHSRDTYAKLMVFLCLLAIDEVLDVVVVAAAMFLADACARKGLQNQLLILYPMDGGPEARRLPKFIATIKAQMDEAFNTAYINVPRPSRYNVDVLMQNFLETCAVEYPG